MVYFFVLVLGLFFGSFGYSLYLRIPAEISLIKRSYCFGCNKKLNVFELLPIISYIFLRGKCSKCHVSIGLYSIIAELSGALLALLVFYNIPYLYEFIFWFLIWFLLIVNSMIDVKHYWLDARLLLTALILSFLGFGIFYPYHLEDATVGLLFGAGFFYFIRFFYNTLFNKEGLGEGDIALIGIVGFLVTWKNLLIVIFLSAFLAIFVVLIIRIINKTKWELPVPFGIFITGSGFLVWFFPQFGVTVRFFINNLLYYF